MKSSLNETVGDGFVYLLLALGVTFQTHEYVGGILFALASAMLTRHWFPERDRREIWVTLLAAWIVATIGAELYSLKYPTHPLPVQIVMAGLGAVSRVVATLLLQLMLRAEKRSDELADRVIDRVLPGEIGGDDKP